MFSWHVPGGIRHNAVLLWVKAARWHGITWEHFCDLDGDRQSFLIASYVTVMQCEAVEAQESVKSKK